MTACRPGGEQGEQGSRNNRLRPEKVPLKCFRTGVHDLPVIKGSALNALTCESDDPSAPEYACIKELMDAVDDYIPTPPRDDSLPFLMPVEDVFTITGRGTVATGRVERGQIKMGDPVEIVGLADEIKKSVITGIEMFRKLLDYAEAGDNVGTLLRGIDKKEIERGQVLAKPGSIHPHTMQNSGASFPSAM